LFGKVKYWARRVREVGVIGAFKRPKPAPGLEEGIAAQAPEESPRAHHYLYAHVELPRLIFEDPKAFIELANTSLSEAWLAHAWESCGEAAQAERRAEKLSPNGLALTNLEIGPHCVCAIMMPFPERGGECFFAAVVPNFEHDGCRYLVLERTRERSGEAPLGVLCEWRQDGSRINHQRWAAGTIEAFINALKDQFRTEQLRQQLAMPNRRAIAWNPRLNETIPKQAKKSPCYRFHHCLFAYNLLQVAAKDSLPQWREILKTTGELPAVRDLWAQAVRLSGADERSFAGEPSAELTVTGKYEGILITLPEALEPPEPYFVYFRTRTVSEERTQVFYLSTEFLVEAEDTYAGRPLVSTGSFGGLYAVYGEAKGRSRDDFLEALATSDSGAQLPTSGDTVQHLMMYGEVYRRCLGVTDQPRKW
jgi:hypothetical protein